MDEATPSSSTPAVATAVAANALAQHTAAPRSGCAPVQFSPPDIAQPDIRQWNGIQTDTVEIVRREPYEYRLHAGCHALVMPERAEREDGETLVEGLPRSTLRTFSGKLSFVPRGHRLSGWQKPRVLTRVTYFYIDPRAPLLDPELRFAETLFQPRLFFHDRDLWALAAKLKAQAEQPESPGGRQYAEIGAFAASSARRPRGLRLHRARASACARR
jgi:AraC family transcriptional regulator